MIKITSNIIPVENFVAITLWPFVFIRKDRQGQYTWKVDNHENIHGEQQKEMLIVGTLVAFILFLYGCAWWSLMAVPLYYWQYLFEWLIKSIIYRNAITAYKNVSFECEAYDNENDIVYINRRKFFAWIGYL